MSDQWKNRWTCPSNSQDGNYTVSEKRDGTWGCSCKGWIFQHKRKEALGLDSDCDHIKRVKWHLRTLGDGQGDPAIKPWNTEDKVLARMTGKQINEIGGTR